MRRVYFDNASTTPLHPKVLEKMLPFLKDDFGNASSIHYFGRKARVAIEKAREEIADIINADASEIYFCSSGTEANNLPVTGIAKAARNEYGKNEIITSEGEHLCVSEAVKNILPEGFVSKSVQLNAEGEINVFTLENLISSKTSLISLIHINNETGSVNDIKSVSSLKKENLYLHTDAVQSFGKIKIDVKNLGVDALSASGHKISGPKGIGFAFIKTGTPLTPMITGGSQERNRRAGTENVAAIAGFAESVKISHEEMEDNFSKISLLKNSFIKGIKEIDGQGISINSGLSEFPYILSVTFKNEFYRNDAESFLMYLDINGIAASNGAACSSGTLKTSHVIKALGLPEADAKGTIRFSFGTQNTLEEVQFGLNILDKMAIKFKR